MSLQRIVGISLLILGIVLFYGGLFSTEALANRVRSFVTGNLTDTTVWCMVGGIASFVGGLALWFSGGRRASCRTGITVWSDEKENET